jgi:hypothetical protein
MEKPVVEHESAVQIGLNSAQKFVNAKDKGLLMKYYLSGEAGSGGVYVWKSKESAEAWYTPEWYAFMTEHYAKPKVTFYNSFVQVDNVNGQILVDDVVV